MLSLFKPKPHADPAIWSVPSITQQTPWPCRIFNFGRAERKGVDYFNCGIVRRWDGLWLVVRRAVWGRFDKLGHNDIVAFKLGDDMQPHMMVPVHLGKRWAIEHFEDPRVMIHNNRVFISCCNFVRNNRGCTFPHQIVCEVNSEWRLVKRHDPVYGNNGADIPEQIKHEKNWGYVNHAGRWHLLYDGCPLTVVPCSDDFQPDATSESISEWDETEYWQHGHIRGGTPPVFHNGLFWTFFHSATPWKGGKRQYHMGAYAFDTVKPYRMVSITPKPLLTASQKDPWFEGKPLCTFPCGALLENGTWTIVGGVNDLKCFWIKIPHEELVQKTIPVEA